MVTEFISEKYMKNKELIFSINTWGFSLKTGQSPQVCLQILKILSKIESHLQLIHGVFFSKNRSQ
jgi:hypothetical protein